MNSLPQQTIRRRSDQLCPKGCNNPGTIDRSVPGLMSMSDSDEVSSVDRAFDLFVDDTEIRTNMLIEQWLSMMLLISK